MNTLSLKDCFNKGADHLEASRFDWFLSRQRGSVPFLKQSVNLNHHNRQRGGFLFVEILIALAMLMIATGLTLKMVQAQIDWDRTATDRLKRQLAVENVAQELSVVPIDELVAEADRLESELSSTIRIQTNSFETGDQTGWHVTITDPNHPSLVEHLWRFNEGS